MIKVTEHGYYVAIWYLEGEVGNWLACLFREGDNAPLTLRWRFRYYADGQTIGSSDIKRYYESKTDADEATALAQIDGLARRLFELGYAAPGYRVERVLVQGNSEKLIDSLAKTEWTSAAPETAQA